MTVMYFVILQKDETLNAAADVLRKWGTEMKK